MGLVFNLPGTVAPLSTGSDSGIIDTKYRQYEPGQPGTAVPSQARRAPTLVVGSPRDSL